MPETGYLAVFLIGLFGGVHCVSMCGGIVGALSMQVESPPRAVPVLGPSPGRGWIRGRQWPLHLAYSLGRIFSYTAAGGAAGALGSFGMLYDGVMPVQIALYVFANLMLVALGLYLAGITRFLASFERMGQVLWRHIQPVTRRFLPVRSAAQALPLGALWGFLPCGMVYMALSLALMTGSAWRGAGLMLAFGLGTLPNLLLAGLVTGRFRAFTRGGKARLAAGLLVLGFGVFGLVRASGLGGKLWSGVMCA
ncbi:MAG: sulfite exporter TauE/SafE family protein [Azoarcus sp.]|jgi:sulfite exporter TauE/SafE|nr:sulfite exporter TauE/SafE family protein [Azoarcus sp.]